MTELGSVWHVKIGKRLAAWLLAAATLPASMAQTNQVAVRIVYQHSRRPAAGLAIAQSRGGRIEMVGETDADGAIGGITRGGRLTISDAVRNIVLAKDVAAANELVVPEAIRIRGALRYEKRIAALPTVKIGFGRRIDPVERMQNVLGREVTAKASRSLFGAAVPKSPADWAEATLSLDARFESGWIASVEDPQVVAYSGADQAGGIDVHLPAILDPGATIDAGTIELKNMAALEIDFRAEGRRFDRIETDAQVEFRSIEWAAGANRAEVGRYLSFLDQVNPRTFALLMGMRPFSFPPGITTIHDLPWMGAAELKASGALLGKTIDVKAAFHGANSEVAFSDQEVLPSRTAPVRLRGRVVFARTYAPVRDAVVVYSCFADKSETKTDPSGQFTIPEACTARDFTLFVTAKDWVSPPRFEPVQVRKRVVLAAGNTPDVVIELPLNDSPGVPKLPPMSALRRKILPLEQGRQTEQPFFFRVRGSPIESQFRQMAIPSDATILQGGEYDEFGPIVAVFEHANMEKAIPVVNAEFVDPITGTIKVTVDQDGVFDVALFTSPFLYRSAASQPFYANIATTVTTTLVMPVRWYSMITVFQTGKGNRPVWPGTPVYFGPFTIDPDATELDSETNNWGVVVMGATNTDVEFVFVANPAMGCFDNEVVLDTRGYGTVQLNDCPKEWDVGSGDQRPSLKRPRQ